VYRQAFHSLVVLALSPVLAAGQASNLTVLEIESEFVPSPVEVGVLLPPEYDPLKGPYPLVLFLHGGGGSWDYLAGSRPLIELAWTRGDLPPAVFVTPATGRTFYMDFRDGSERWETFIMDELIPHLRNEYALAVDARGTVVTGLSMGGVGALRLGFKHSTVFGAVAALAPAFEPAFRFQDIDPVDRKYRSDQDYARQFGDPIDEEYWEANHPLSIARATIEELAASELQIYVEVGDLDQFGLFRGAEVLHRMLFDAGVKHEYRLVRGVGHVGEFRSRLLQALGFIGRYLRGSLQPRPGRGVAAPLPPARSP